MSEELISKVRFGVRVEVQFGKKKTWSGLVAKVHNEKPDHRTKSVFSVIDEVPLVNETQLKLPPVRWRVVGTRRI